MLAFWIINIITLFFLFLDYSEICPIQGSLILKNLSDMARVRLKWVQNTLKLIYKVLVISEFEFGRFDWFFLLMN